MITHRTYPCSSNKEQLLLVMCLDRSHSREPNVFQQHLEDARLDGVYAGLEGGGPLLADHPGEET